MKVNLKGHRGCSLSHKREDAIIIISLHTSLNTKDGFKCIIGGTAYKNWREYKTTLFSYHSRGFLHYLIQLPNLLLSFPCPLLINKRHFSSFRLSGLSQQLIFFSFLLNSFFMRQLCHHSGLHAWIEMVNPSCCYEKPHDPRFSFFCKHCPTNENKHHVRFDYGKALIRNVKKKSG